MATYGGQFTLTIEKLERYIAELKKSAPTKNEVLAADEMKEAILDRAGI